MRVPVLTLAEPKKRRAKQAQKRGGRNRKARRPQTRRRRQGGADRGSQEFKRGTVYDPSRAHPSAFGTSDNHHAVGRRRRRAAAQLKLDPAAEKFSGREGAQGIRGQVPVHRPLRDAMILDCASFAEHLGLAGRTGLGEESPAAQEGIGRLLTTAKPAGPAAGRRKSREPLKPIRSASNRAARHQREPEGPARGDRRDYPACWAKGWDLGRGGDRGLW